MNDASGRLRAPRPKPTHPTDAGGGRLSNSYWRAVRFYRPLMVVSIDRSVEMTCSNVGGASKNMGAIAR